MAEQISCSISKLRKNARRGTMLECARKKKINYYGYQPIDDTIKKMISEKSDALKTTPEVLGQISGIRSRVKRTLGYINNAKDSPSKQSKIIQWKEQLEALKKRYTSLVLLSRELITEDEKRGEEIHAAQQLKQIEKEKKISRIQERERMKEEKLRIAHEKRIEKNRVADEKRRARNDMRNKLEKEKRRTRTLI